MSESLSDGLLAPSSMESDQSSLHRESDLTATPKQKKMKNLRLRIHASQEKLSLAMMASLICTKPAPEPREGSVYDGSGSQHHNRELSPEGLRNDGSQLSGER